MIHRFGRFELDEGRRELRLDGAALEMQPRVFDLLVYLVRNPERVVPKEELLSAIWPDVVVTDSSIMRIVSLIRSTLRAGGQPDAIQTYARQGYRFTGDLDEVPAPAAADRHLARARAACAGQDWPQALQAFRRVHATGRLQAADFEQWANAALYVGQPNEAIYPLERAVAACTQNADRLGAARAALKLTNVHLEGRAVPVARGWHRRAAVFLAEEPGETPEHGLHTWLSARIALFEGDLPRALEHAKKAEALARRIQDPDVEALGLIYRAHVELATGEIRSGLTHLDEAGAATLAGTVSPWVSGIVFCSVIWIHLDRGDLHRAGQWTDQFTRWARRNAAFGAPGLCRLHRGEVMCLLGDLRKAESEVVEAREMLAETVRYAEGDACRVLGEIRLLRGDLAGAEEAFRSAHELGWNPLPGRALLQAQQGRFAAAIKSLHRGLVEPNWADGQRRGILLGHLACVAVQAGLLPLARQSLADLEKSADLRATAGCEAVYWQAAAELALAERHRERAIAALRKAMTVWLEAGSKINVAHLRLRLAEILAQGGENDEADLELTAAEKAFAKMGAEPMVARCQAVRKATATGGRRRG
jgi:DNA-binding winged helix-turn-helix (wHTH) protein